MLSWREEARVLWALAWPMILAQLGFMTMGLTDTIVVGHVDERALASVALGNLWSFSFLIFGMGVLRGLDPFFAQGHGAQDQRALTLTLWRALGLAAGVSAPIVAAHLIAEPGMSALGQPAPTIPLAASYSAIVSLSVLPMMVSLTLSQLLQNLGKPRGPMLVVASGNVVNLGANLALVFGVPALGVPALGALGSAWATVIVRVAMLALMIAVAWPVLRQHLPTGHGAALMDLGAGLDLLKRTLPVGFQSALESWAFGAMGLMVGVFGERALAAHSVAMNLAALSFMIVLGLSGAAAARTGHLIGMGQPWRRAGWLAVGMAVAWMSCSALTFLLLAKPLASLFTREQAVVAAAASLLPVAASFQLFDGIQAVAFGVLRGAGDVRWPALANILGYWVLGLPLAYGLGVVQGRGPVVIWQCVALALVVVAATLLWRLRRVMDSGGLRVLDSPTKPAAAAAPPASLTPNP